MRESCGNATKRYDRASTVAPPLLPAFRCEWLCRSVASAARAHRRGSRDAHRRANHGTERLCGRRGVWPTSCTPRLESLKDTEWNLIGRVAVRTNLRWHLINRLNLVELLKRHPELRQIEVAPPIVIVGLFRTGTTFLHNIMAADPNTRAGATWELAYPVGRARDLLGDEKWRRRRTAVPLAHDPHDRTRPQRGTPRHHRRLRRGLLSARKRHGRDEVRRWLWRLAVCVAHARMGYGGALSLASPAAPGPVCTTERPTMGLEVPLASVESRRASKSLSQCTHRPHPPPGRQGDRVTMQLERAHGLPASAKRQPARPGPLLGRLLARGARTRACCARSSPRIADLRRSPRRASGGAQRRSSRTCTSTSIFRSTARCCNVSSKLPPKSRRSNRAFMTTASRISACKPKPFVGSSPAIVLDSPLIEETFAHRRPRQDRFLGLASRSRLPF